MDQASKKQVAPWLLACCALIFAMVVAGGVTRLTHFLAQKKFDKPMMGKFAGIIAPLTTLELRRINGTF